jgi:hypothetical protein
MLQGHVLHSTSHSCGTCPVTHRVHGPAEHGAGPNSSPRGSPTLPTGGEEEAADDEEPEIARGDPFIPDFRLPGSPISVVGRFSDNESGNSVELKLVQN